VPSAAGVLSPIFDRDGDGFTAVLGGGDCDDGNAARSPYGVDVAGNGVDEDCQFGDFTAPARAAAPPGPPADVVVLVTVTGLGVTKEGALEPKLPETSKRLDGGTRFATPVMTAGDLRHVARVLFRGRFPWAIGAEGSGMPDGGPSIPVLGEAAGVRSIAAWDGRAPDADLNALFPAGNASGRSRSPEAIVSIALRNIEQHRATAEAGRLFVWIHLAQADGAADRAIAQLVDRVATSSGAASHRVIVVGLAGGKTRRTGPLAIVGTSIAAGTMKEPVGLLDVYPTLLESLGLVETPADWPDFEPIAGTSLLSRPPRPAAVKGRLGVDVVIDGADAGARDRVLAERLEVQSRLRAAARAGRMPDALEGSAATFGNALDVFGCTVTQRAARQVAVTLWMRGGDRLDADYELYYKLSVPKGKPIRGHAKPLYGAYPFGSWRAGEIVGVPVLIDTRGFSPGTTLFWLGITNGTIKLDAASAAGNTPTMANVCAIEVAP
jgi:hypothetical protein